MLELQNYDEAAAPQRNGGRTPTSDLPDADYEFEVKSAVIKISKEKKTPILSMDLIVLTPGEFEGAVIERPSFMVNQESFNMALADFLTLGFDSNQWTKANGRPASQELEKAIHLIPGLRISGTKKKNGTFHNIYINKRLDDGRPLKFSSNDLNNAPTDPF